MKDFIWRRSYRDRLLRETDNLVTRTEMLNELQVHYAEFNLNVLTFLGQGGEVLSNQWGEGFAEYLREGR